MGLGFCDRCKASSCHPLWNSGLLNSEPDYAANSPCRHFEICVRTKGSCQHWGLTQESRFSIQRIKRCIIHQNFASMPCSCCNGPPPHECWNDQPGGCALRSGTRQNPKLEPSNVPRSKSSRVLKTVISNVGSLTLYLKPCTLHDEFCRRWTLAFTVCGHRVEHVNKSFKWEAVKFMSLWQPF